jgi:CHAT domain-containing protein
VLVTEPPKTRVPDSVAEYRDVAWLATRQPITVLPSVASLKTLRRVAKTNDAKRVYLGIANPLLEGRQDDRELGEYYRKQAQAARDKRCSDQPIRLQVAATRGRRAVTGLGGLFRGGRLDIEDIRKEEPLPETADEVCEVGRRLRVPASEILLGNAAREATLKELSNKGRLAEYGIVHFATHGALTGQVKGTAEPGLILTPPRRGTSDTKALELDDGYLTASEIAGLKLNANWVILSACNTAGASGETAEPLSGLARAFFYAGARTLLVSHWAVGSDAAVKLTTRAFSELQTNPAIGRAEAFRISMREVIDKGSSIEAHPSIWAPFVVVGEGAPAK